MHSDATLLQVAERDGTALQLGGCCAVVGGLGSLAVAAAHGDLPSDTVESALGYVAARPSWQAIHLAGIACVLLWVAAVAGLTTSLDTRRGAVLGRLAVIAMAIGATLYTVDYSIDGYALKQAADAWATSTGADAELDRQVGAALLGVLHGTVTAAVTWAFGPPFLLAGVAVAVSRSYPRWLGWIAAATGGASLLGGIGAYLGSEAGFLAALAGGAASAVWLTVTGVLMWRRAAGRSARSAP